ncbi:MAG: hypothetical protein ACYCX9_13025 [Candidatus Dormibacteria bacterium]
MDHHALQIGADLEGGGEVERIQRAQFEGRQPGPGDSLVVTLGTTNPAW